jgi:hypothetical protein
MKHAGISTDWLCLRVAQIPRSRDQAIFVLTTDNRQTHKPTALPPAAYARMRGNNLRFFPIAKKCLNEKAEYKRGVPGAKMSRMLYNHLVQNGGQMVAKEISEQINTTLYTCKKCTPVHKST